MTIRKTGPRSGQAPFSVGVNPCDDFCYCDDNDNSVNSTSTGDKIILHYYKRWRIKCMHSVCNVQSILLNNYKLN